MKAFTFSFLVLLSAFVFLFQFGAAPDPRLVVLYATCSVNKQYLSPYNPKIRFTPNLENFAEDSVLFMRHMTDVGFSGPAYASLFSGNSIYHHGVYYHPERLKDSNYLIAEAFRDSGFETFFWTAHIYASPELNYSQGVPRENVFREPLGDPTAAFPVKSQFKAILARLSSNPRYRAFIETAFTITHGPYSTYSDPATVHSFCNTFPEECRGITDDDVARYSSIDQKNHASLSWYYDETIKSLGLNPEEVSKLQKVLEVTYKSDINLLDRSFGHVIDAIRDAGLLDHALIIFTSDHGEVLFRSNSYIKWGHGLLEPEVLNIPLIIWSPGNIPKNRAYPFITRSMDVYPTILGLSHIHRPHVTDGKDLSLAMMGNQPPPDLYAYAFEGIDHPSVGGPGVASVAVQLTRGDWICRFWLNGKDSATEVYNARKDPELRRNLFDEKNATHLRMREELKKYRELLIKGYKVGVSDKSPEEIREQLHALGYIK